MSPVNTAERPSMPESHSAVSVSSALQPWRRLLSFVDPGFLIAVGYMDPGNWRPISLQARAMAMLCSSSS